MSSVKISEEKQRELFIENFTDSTEKLFREIPVFSRSIDLVKYNTISGKITAIEFKLTDWKRAIQQALSVAICFDYLEICIPLPKRQITCENILKVCGEYGIGVYFFNQENSTFEMALKPKAVCSIWEIQKTHIVEYLGGISDE